MEVLDKMPSPYRADHVGSLLRPPELLEARAKLADGKITAAELREVEDASILKALEMERASGIDVLRTANTVAPAGAALPLQARSMA